MSPTDEQIERLITDCRLMGDALIADGQEIRAQHVLNAMLDLRKAYSPEKQEEQWQKGIERLRRMKRTA